MLSPPSRLNYEYGGASSSKILLYACRTDGVTTQKITIWMCYKYNLHHVTTSLPMGIKNSGHEAEHYTSKFINDLLDIYFNFTSVLEAVFIICVYRLRNTGQLEVEVGR